MIHKQISAALQLEHSVEMLGEERLPSCFAVTDLGVSAIGAVGSAVAGLVSDIGLASTRPSVQVERRLASLWFAQSIHPINWEMPQIWDAIAGDYQTRDGWIRLHTNLPHHRAAALKVLQTSADREKVSAAVRTWDGNALETEIVKAGGVAAAMRSCDEWAVHPQGQAVGSEPLITWDKPRRIKIRSWPATKERPLNGLRVLDLTRVLAGPVATRTLAGFGAEILRIDPPEWDEPYVAPDITLGKRCAFLDLENPEDRQKFEALLLKADILIHGYRPGALDGLGYSQSTRLRLAPNVIEITLNAYGWTGPWAKRRGFDSLVQMSSGIAHAGMDWADQECPTPLPVQALDHATGYLMAAAAVQAIGMAVKGNEVSNARLSLARTAALLTQHRQSAEGILDKQPVPKDFAPHIEQTPWGKANRLKPALNVEGVPMEWSLPACEFGSSPAEWL